MFTSSNNAFLPIRKVTLFALIIFKTSLYLCFLVTWSIIFQSQYSQNRSFGAALLLINWLSRQRDFQKNAHSCKHDSHFLENHLGSEKLCQLYYTQNARISKGNQCFGLNYKGFIFKMSIFV